MISKLSQFKSYSQGVIDLYRKFGKLRYIDANDTEVNVYAETKKAVLPDVFFMVGPTMAGKSSLGNALCDRTNMGIIEFEAFVREKGLG